MEKRNQMSKHASKPSAMESWLWNSGCGILAVVSWLWNHGCGIMVVESWLWNLGILAVESWLGALWEASGRHLGGLWRHLEVSGRHLLWNPCFDNFLLEKACGFHKTIILFPISRGVFEGTIDLI